MRSLDAARYKAQAASAMRIGWYDVLGAHRCHLVDAQGDSVCGTWHYDKVILGLTGVKPRCTECQRIEALHNAP